MDWQALGMAVAKNKQAIYNESPECNCLSTLVACEVLRPNIFHTSCVSGFLSVEVILV